MRTNPFTDTVHFLTEGYWATPVYWVLLLASLAIAAVVWNRLPEQRSGDNVVRFIIRSVVGLMWWQQSLWKVPPDFEGLRHWTEEIVAHAAFPLQSQLVKDLILTHFTPFGYFIYFAEVAIGVSLILGLFVRASSTVGALLILNIYFGLYRSESEWPWTYAFLVLLMALFAFERYGRSLGADALIAARKQPPSGLMRALIALT
jgi:uncharacterized membrane protein YphA (DoxX/SURF4 family)